MTAFIGITAVMVLCAAKVMSGEAADNMMSIFCQGISNFPLIMHAGALNTIGEIASGLLLVPISILGVEGISYFGEEYAWRGCLQGKLQNIFGKRGGVILLGIIWELWHMPLCFMIYGPDQWKMRALLISMHMLNVVGFSVFLDGHI